MSTWGVKEFNNGLWKRQRHLYGGKGPKMRSGGRRGDTGLCGPLDQPGINGIPGARNRLEVQVSAGDLDQHEREVGVKSLQRHAGLCQVAVAQLARRAFGEVVDPFLRLDALVDVIVTRKYDVHAVPGKQRLQQQAQLGRRTVRFSR